METRTVRSLAAASAAVVAVITAVAVVAVVMMTAPAPSADQANDPTDRRTAQEYDTLANPPLPTATPTAPLRVENGTTVSNFDGSTVVALDTHPETGFETDSRTLTFFHPDGAVEVDVESGFELRAVSTDGSYAALVRHRPIAAPATSEILVVDDAGHDRLFSLDGRIEPEAFATDGQALFVIDHEVAADLDSYRVRPLNLETGQLEPMLGPSKQPLLEDMNGHARRQMWGTDFRRLYTLYIRQTEHGDGHRHANGNLSSDGFVHILDLDEEWAFCLDLPPDFGQGELATTALAVNGDTIAVADLTAGRLAFASAEGRTVTRVVDLPSVSPLPDWADLSSSAGRDHEPELNLGLTEPALLLAYDRRAEWFDAASLAPLGAPLKFARPLLGVTSAGSSEVLVWESGADTPSVHGVPRS